MLRVSVCVLVLRWFSHLNTILFVVFVRLDKLESLLYFVLADKNFFVRFFDRARRRFHSHFKRSSIYSKVISHWRSEMYVCRLVYYTLICRTYWMCEFFVRARVQSSIKEEEKKLIWSMRMQYLCVRVWVCVWIPVFLHLVLTVTPCPFEKFKHSLAFWNRGLVLMTSLIAWIDVDQYTHTQRRYCCSAIRFDHTLSRSHSYRVSLHATVLRTARNHSIITFVFFSKFF